MLNLAVLLPYQKNYEQGALVGEGGIPGLYSVADMFRRSHKNCIHKSSKVKRKQPNSFWVAFKHIAYMCSHPKD